MSNLKTKMLVGASALVAAGAAMAGSAQAAVLHVYGGGSSLVAPYWRQAGDCYGVPQQLVFKGAPPTTQTVAPFNYTGTKSTFNCATQHTTDTRAINYISTGSGTGIAAVFSHDASKYGDTDPTKAGDQFYPSVNYGLSDNSLGATDVGVYNNGGTSNGVTVVAPGQTPGAGQYANPKEKYGALIQFPISIDPVAIAYDPVYKKVRLGSGAVKSYSFNIQGARADGSGGLKLDVATFCKIFNGEITNWNDSRLQAANGGVSLQSTKDTGDFDVPLQIVGRFESSGTTSIFTRHVAAACADTTNNQYADAASTLPANLQGAHYLKANTNTSPAGETLGKFTLADGSDGVAKYLDFTQDPGTKSGDTLVQGRIGYLGPDYVLPAVLTTQTNTYGLNSANVQNSSGVFVAPTGKAAVAAFGNLLPPQSTANGSYNPSGRGDRANPADWVEPSSKTSVLADPSAAGGYPIVGTTNFLGYQCYSGPARANTIADYVTFYTTSDVVSDSKFGLLTKAGLAPLPQAWEVAIRNTFAKDSPGLNLNFQAAGSGECSGAKIVGG